MKPTILLPIALVSALLAGCHSNKSPDKSAKPTTTTTSTSTTTTASAKPPVAPSSGGIDTTQLVSAFKNADTETTRVVQDIVASVNKKDWSGALSQLQKIEKIPGLTASQADAVKGLSGSVSTRTK